MKIRIGMEGGRKPVLQQARDLRAPILVSANSLWDQTRQQFSGYACYQGFDTALDSGGFIALQRYGGYRWSVDQYVRLAGAMGPTWWAQMDFCCEPELAAQRAAVWKRIDQTAAHLQTCQAAARSHRVPAPMPVLQGWHPEDYCAGPIYARGYRWPQLVGIGSVCRRHVAGNDGILAVVAALDRAVPRFVRFHLFGVKSTALVALVKRFPGRLASVDSMAWNVACRKAAHATGTRCDGPMRASYMAAWYQKQTHLLQISEH